MEIAIVGREVCTSRYNQESLAGGLLWAPALFSFFLSLPPF